MQELIDKSELRTPKERQMLGDVVTWDILRLKPNPLNPRGVIQPDDASISELAESIKSHGLLQPITATPTGIIVAGHRRYYACLVAGLQMVSVIVRELSEREQLEVMLIENVQRRDLNPVQIAKGYKDLSERGMSIAEIAKKVGWAKATVSRHLAILELPEEIQQMFVSGHLALGYIPHLTELKDPAEQIRLAREAAEKGWLINEMSAAVNGIKRNKRPTTETADETPPYHPWHHIYIPETAFDYLVRWAKIEGKELNTFLTERLIWDCECDLDCQELDEMSDEELSEWKEKFAPITVLNR